MQHRRPEQGVEVDDVLADKMVELSIRIRRPERLEVELWTALTQVFEARHVANRRIQPDIEKLTRRIRDLEAEVRRIARDIPIGEALVEPLIEFVDNLRL